MSKDSPAVDDKGARVCLDSCRQEGIEIDFDATDQRLDPLDKTSIHGLQAFRMAGNVAGQVAQELSEHRIPSDAAARVSTTSPLGRMA